MALDKPLTHFIGDSFSFAGLAGGLSGGDFTGWIGRSMLRYAAPGGKKVADLVFAWADASLGTFLLTHEDTSGWEPGAAFFDVQFTTPAGQKVRSEPLPINLIRGATHD